jgi:hypothetical protein
MVAVRVINSQWMRPIRRAWSARPRIDLLGDRGALLSPVVVLLLFGAGVFLLLVLVMTWASSQAPK